MNQRITDEEQLDQWFEQYTATTTEHPEQTLNEFVKAHCQHAHPQLVERFRQEVLRLESNDSWIRAVGGVSGSVTTSGVTPKRFQAGDEPIPGYRLESVLGSGGFGEVWRVRGPGGFSAALKFVKLGGNVGATELRALNVIKNIRHPHLVSISGAWRSEGWLMIAMELADQTLDQRLREIRAKGQQGIPRDELLRYMTDAAEGLDFLNEPRHRTENGTLISIQHRDVKPQNFLLVGGSLKVADFGLVRVLHDADTGHTGNWTCSYAAPEFFDGKTTRQSDQYSLGITYCHLRGGRLPFVGDPKVVMMGHLGKAPDLSMLPLEERPIVARALAKVPSERWPSCGEFVKQLVKCEQMQNVPTESIGESNTKNSEEVTVSTPGISKPSRRGFNRRYLLAGTVAAGSLLAVYASGGRLPSLNLAIPGSGGLRKYKRGFADTIIRYADRSYDGVAWRSIKNLSSLGEVVPLDTSWPEIRRLIQVCGWDSDKFWISADAIRKGLVFESQNEEWKCTARLPNCEDPMLRLIDSDSLVAAGTDTSEKMFVLRRQGTQEIKASFVTTEITVVAEDLFYVHHTRNLGVLKVEGRSVTDMTVEKNKEATVHGLDKSPLAEYPVSSVRLTRSFSSGHALGLAERRVGNGQQIVEYQSGIWTAIAEGPTEFIHQAWFGETKGAKFLVGVGKGGYVYTHDFGKGGLTRTLTNSVEPTSRDLIGVWGAGLDKFWVMDKSGTVWEQTVDSSRVVVQGLYRDKVEFRSAWVSPTGTVIAVTDKEVYRLG